MSAFVVAGVVNALSERCHRDPWADEEGPRNGNRHTVQRESGNDSASEVAGNQAFHRGVYVATFVRDSWRWAVKISPTKLFAVPVEVSGSDLLSVVISQHDVSGFVPGHCFRQMNGRWIFFEKIHLAASVAIQTFDLRAQLVLPKGLAPEDLFVRRLAARDF